MPGSLVYILRLSLVNHFLYSFRADVRFEPFEAFYPVRAGITRDGLSSVHPAR
jgi:hypothetical protein